MAIQESKRCSRCEEVKGSEDFNLLKKTGELRAWCKECNKEYGRNYYKNNKERFRNYSRLWRSANKDRKMETDRRYSRTEKSKERAHNYYEANKEHIKKKAMDWKKAKRKGEPYKVYRLYWMEDEGVAYIGYSGDLMTNRISSHRTDKNYECYETFQRLGNPRVIIFETFPKTDEGREKAKESEAWHIGMESSYNPKLLNQRGRRT